MRLTLLLFIFLFLPQITRAEEIAFMVNMNYSQKELDAIREATGKKVITVPPENLIADGEALTEMHDALMKSIKNIRPEMSDDDLTNAIVDIELHGLSWNGDRALRDKLATQINEYSKASKRLKAKEKELGSIDQQIRAKLKEFRKTGKKIQTLAISAHSQGTIYSGETSFDLENEEINALQTDYPELFENPEHVLLLGCYTMTKTNRVRNREMFPNATLIAGFYRKAYSRKSPMDWKFIKEVIGMADETDKRTLNGDIPTEQEVRDALKALSSVTANHTLIDYCTYQVEGIPETKQSCEEEWREFLPVLDQFQDEYLSLINPLKDPPKKTEGTALREFYNQAQNVCFEKNNSEITDEDAAAFIERRQSIIDMAIRLIFWWNIQKNYGVYFSDKINEFKKALAAAEVENSMPDLDGNASRVEFVKSYNELRNRIKEAQRTVKKSLTQTEDSVEREILKNERDSLQIAYDSLVETYDPLIILDEVPLNWHKPNAVTGPGEFSEDNSNEDENGGTNE